MDRIDLYRLYVIGSEVHPMLDVSRNDTTVGALFLPLQNALRAINELLNPEGPIRLDFGRDAAAQAQSSLIAMDREHFRNEDGGRRFPENYSDPIPSYEMWPIKRALEMFEPVFQTEMQRAATYLVPKRGTYDLGDLVDRADETFPSELRVLIGAQALEEYRAAGRCYAFGLFTASGYHCCRATEAVLRDYYRELTGKTDKGTETWGKLLEEIEKIEGANAADPKTLGHIKHVKDHDRNPLSHLRANLSSIDADILLSASKVAMAAMASELSKRSATKPVAKNALSALFSANG